MRAWLKYHRAQSPRSLCTPLRLSPYLRARLLCPDWSFNGSPKVLIPNPYLKQFSVQASTTQDLRDAKWITDGNIKQVASLGAVGRSAPHNGGDEEAGRNGLTPPEAERQNPESWVILLERFLPSGLSHATGSSAASRAKPPKSLDLLDLLSAATFKENAATDILAYLGLKKGRWLAALHLVEQLLSNVGEKVASRRSHTLPSNLSWPVSASLADMCSAPISVKTTTYKNKEKPAQWSQISLDPRYSDSMSDQHDRTMLRIWKTLGYIIIEAAELPEDEADAAMKFVYRAIAHIHMLGLVPENVYSYVPSSYTSSVQRPPIMHLLSSRIFTTMSDAVWRANQDEVIAKAADSGISYKDLGHDPPGGRFRLKVRALGPQVWLEFVLWCCVDGGFAMAGAQIIEHLRRQTEHPWFSVNWTFSRDGSAVDWDRVKLRHGGAVGLIEGYSSEQPFAVMEPRTISTEVVLALVECAALSVNVGMTRRGSTLLRVQNSIKNFIGFLEPHSLPAGYLDNLTVRLLQTGGFDSDRDPEALHKWTEAFIWMRSLESASAAGSAFSLNIDSILSNSKLLDGLLHQSLEAFVNNGDVRQALEVFTRIQHFVDLSKLRSISAFIETVPIGQRGFFSSRTLVSNEEFVKDHGQLPLYKIAAFLDLVTDSSLIRLGKWLLYSEDVDGPLIPESVYNTFCLTPALARFAAVSQDGELLQKLAATRRGISLEPSIGLLKTFANTSAFLSQFNLTTRVLNQIKKRSKTGIDVGNLASLAAAMMHLEVQINDFGILNEVTHLEQARAILENMLRGAYHGNIAVYTADQHALIRRQLGSVLRILECVPNSALPDIAGAWRTEYESGNEVNLYTKDFNILLGAIVETRGAMVGRKIWDLFCEDPGARSAVDRADVLSSYIVPVSVEGDEGDWYYGHYLRMADQRAPRLKGHVPIIEVDDWEPEVLTGDIDQDNDEGDTTTPPLADGYISFDGEFDRHSRPMVPMVVEQSAAPNFLNPVVVPNLRTLRLIVRGALAERQARERQRLDTSEQRSVLRWSRQFFRALGLKPNSIEQEIQQQLLEGEDGQDNIANEKKAYEQRRRFKERERRTVGFRKTFREYRSSTKVPVDLIRRVEGDK